MLTFMRKSLGLNFDEGQTRGMRGLFFGVIVFLVALLLANVTVWLLTGLWNVSIASPFGLLGFAGFVALALMVGIIAAYYASRPKSPRPTIDDDQREELQGLREEVKAGKLSQAERRYWEEARAPTADFLKTQINEAIQAARANRDGASIEKAEQLMDKLRAADPNQEAWLQNQRWLLDKLKEPN